MKSSKIQIMHQLEQDYQRLEREGYVVFGVFVYGSQNYGLETENSDIDVKALIVPNRASLV